MQIKINIQAIKKVQFTKTIIAPSIINHPQKMNCFLNI